MLDLTKGTETIEELNQAMAYKKGNPIFHPSQQLKDKMISWKSEKKNNHPFSSSIIIDTNTTWDDIDDAKKNYPNADKTLILRDLLFQFGGETILTDFYDDELDKVLERGQIWYGDKITLIKGRTSMCHHNSCDLWETNKSQSRICTGYALGEDGTWVQHSWLIQQKLRQNRLIETTSKRLLYFGFVRTLEECEDFVWDHY